MLTSGQRAANPGEGGAQSLLLCCGCLEGPGVPWPEGQHWRSQTDSGMGARRRRQGPGRVVEVCASPTPVGSSRVWWGCRPPRTLWAEGPTPCPLPSGWLTSQGALWVGWSPSLAGEMRSESPTVSPARSLDTEGDRGLGGPQLQSLSVCSVPRVGRCCSPACFPPHPTSPPVALQAADPPPSASQIHLLLVTSCHHQGPGLLISFLGDAAAS